MSAHGQTPSVNEDSPQEEQEQSTPTYDDRLASDLYKDYSSQNALFQQLIIALAAGGISYGSEVINAYNLLKNPLDAEKLVKDPSYKREVERAVQLVKRHEGKKIADGRSKYKDIVPKTQRAIERTNSTHSKLVAEKSALLLNDNLYLRHLQSSYNLDDKQLQALTYSAMKQIRENPSLSIKDALRMEAEKFSLKQAIKDVENENKGKKLTSEEKKALVEKKLTEKHIDFETSLTTANTQKTEKYEVGETKSYAEYEQKRIDAIIKTQIEENKQILTTQPHPTSSQPIPIPTPPPPFSPPSLIPSIPVSTPGFNLPGFAFPAGFTQGLNNMFGGLGKGIGSVFGKNGVFSKAFDLANNVGKQLINRGLDAIAPGLGMAIGKINDVIKSILGIDVEGLILKGAVVVVGAVAAVVIILPIIIGVGVFSYVTGSNPVKLSYINEKTIGWNEFNKQYLTIDNSTQLSWQQFEQGNLTPQKQYLSLEK